MEIDSQQTHHVKFLGTRGKRKDAGKGFPEKERGQTDVRVTLDFFTETLEAKAME